MRINLTTAIVSVLLALMLALFGSAVAQIANPQASTTTITMPTGDTAVTALYGFQCSASFSSSPANFIGPGGKPMILTVKMPVLGRMFGGKPSGTITWVAPAPGCP